MKIRYRRGNGELIKDLNRSLVIEQIRLQGPISRTELSKKTELGLSTMTNIVESLLSESLVYEVGSGSSSGGRKPVLLKFNGDAGVVVGIKIEPTQIILSIADLEVDIQHKHYVKLSKDISNESVSILLRNEIESLQRRLDSKQKLYGIGIAISGLVDRSLKKLKHSPMLAWQDFDFSSLEDHFGVPVFVDNDANVFTLAHMWSGIGREYNHFIGVTFGIGVGAGIVINKNLYRGDFGGAGELGHIVIQREGTLCYCGQRGCLEMYVSDDYVLQEVRSLAVHGLTETIRPDQVFHIDDIYEKAKDGDKKIQDILSKQGGNLGTGLKSLVNLLNPEAVILGGEGIRGMPFVYNGIKRELEHHFFSKHDKKLNVHISDLGDDVWLKGACALVLDDVFKTPIYR